MSRRHHLTIRTRSARFLQTPELDAYFCDHGAEPFVAASLQGHGRTFSRRNRHRFVLDLGGSVMDTDTFVDVRAAGYRFQMWEHQVGEYLHKLEGMKPANDRPEVMILGGRWIRVVVTLATAAALRDVLRPMREEIVKRVQKRDQEMAARMEGVNKRLVEKGVSVVLAPAVPVDP